MQPCLPGATKTYTQTAALLDVATTKAPVAAPTKAGRESIAGGVVKGGSCGSNGKQGGGQDDSGADGGGG